jgi:hypothetical protein
VIVDHAADVDQVVSYYTEADSTLHSVIASVSALIETVAPFGDADPTFAPLPLFAPALSAFGGRSGMQTRFTPLGFAAVSFLPK